MYSPDSIYRKISDKLVSVTDEAFYRRGFRALLNDVMPPNAQYASDINGTYSICRYANRKPYTAESPIWFQNLGITLLEGPPR